jgi:tetratricopeptide (TPR) repeat protein
VTAFIQQASALKSKTAILLVIMSLLSCEKPAPPSVEIPATPSNSSLAAAQLALAQTHFDNGSPLKGIPYLQAALSNQPSPETRAAFEKTLTSTDFTFPVTALRHPFPVLRFVASENDLFVAIGGDHPTVIRWNLSDEPSVPAVMLPAKARDIPHLSLSPNSRYLLVHRDQTSLLCLAETLKPIAALDPFPEKFDPETCQPFSEKSLLFAAPSEELAGATAWRIRDAATGQVLREETIRHLSPPLAASFHGTTLRIITQDGKGIAIPIQGEVEPFTPTKIKATSAVSGITRTDDKTLTFTRTIRIAPDEIPKLTEKTISALSGYKLDPATQTLSEIPIPNRLETLSAHFPETIPPTLKIFSADTAVTRRLADAYPEQFPQLTAEARSHTDLIRKVFATGDHKATLAVIDSATHGLPLATALYLAIESQDPALISRALEKATDLPPALRALAKRESSADTNLDHLRTIEDWHGYESPDFTPLLNRFRNERADILTALTLPAQPTEDNISALSLLLTNPTTLEDLGKPLVAEKAIRAASTLSENPAHAATAIRLAVLAQNLGTHPAAILRVRATAFTALNDFASAHAAWIDLITHQPESTHLPSDYTEAAYTAFETGDARQAIEILNTGLFRFPNSATSAIRSAWIALLTDHDEDALRYLNHAAKLGLPPAEIENTTALFAIAHAKLGDFDMAASHHAQLTAISPKWNDVEMIGALTWPDSFKQSLYEIISGGPETEPWPSPESDPTDTAPLPGELPIVEPPLPSR